MKDSKLHTICYLLSEFTFIPVRLYKNNILQKSYYPLNIPYDPFVLYEKEILNLSNKLNYYITKRYNYYSLIKHEDYKIVIGPTRINEITKEDIRELLINISQNSEFIENTLSFVNSISKMSLENLLKLSSLINLLLNNEYDDSLFNTNKEKDLIINKIVNERIKNKDYELINTDKYNYKYFNDESTLISTIASGNVDKVLKFTHELNLLDSNINESQIKQNKHRFVTYLTLISRVAIRKGIDQDIVGNIINRYLNEIIQTNDIHKINLIFNDMLITFTYFIKDVSSSSSPLINKINSYINANITKNITVNEIAAALYVSRPYISAYFKKETGLNLSNYIYQNKINCAKNLLSITNRSLREISLYLGFSSTSHFSSTFKKYEGMTPNEYRQKRTSNSCGF